jgi:Bacterial Ig-like domain (group 2)
MFVRRSVLGLLPLCLGSLGFITLIGCANNGLDSVQVTPASQALVVGQTAQFTATGTFGNAKKPTTQNITTSVTWTSSVPSVATISAAGIATGVGAGTTTITASASSFNGHVSSSATLTVTGSSGGTSGGTVTSLSIIPASQAVASPTQTTQFIAIGTTSSGATVNLSNQVAWSSSSPQIATINTTTGLATGVGKGSTTITAIYTNVAGGTVVTGTATFTVEGGASQQFTAVTILPSSQTLSSLGQTAQFIALATSGTTGLQQDVTSSPQLKWSSSVPSAGSISATGLAKDLGAGDSTVAAVLTNSDGSVISNTATLSTTLTAAPQDLLSLTIIPSSIGLQNLQGSGQFLAIGTFSTTPYVRDVTNSAQWITTAPNVFPVTTNNSVPPSAGTQNGGVATAFGTGSATIVAEMMGSDKTVQTATATISCPLVYPNPGSPATATTPATPPTPGSCFPGSQAPALLQTLTLYNEGLNTTNWLVTAPSATSTANVLHCGPGSTSGDSVCTATYPLNTQVILTAPNKAGVKFGGWSYNCTPSDPNGVPLNPVVLTEAGPNYCTVNFTSSNTDITVGAIFN